jgi:hypothetical protein
MVPVLSYQLLTATAVTSDERKGLTFAEYNIFTFYMLWHEHLHNIYKASVIPG